jgi:hypothetical protein
MPTPVEAGILSKEEKKLLISSLKSQIETSNRAAGKTKRPEFRVVYEREAAELQALIYKVEKF